MTSEPDDTVRAIIHLVTGDDTALEPTSEPGALLAALTADQARRFALIAIDLTQDRYVAVAGDDGALRLKAVE